MNRRLRLLQISVARVANLFKPLELVGEISQVKIEEGSVNVVLVHSKAGSRRQVCFGVEISTRVGASIAS